MSRKISALTSKLAPLVFALAAAAVACDKEAPPPPPPPVKPTPPPATAAAPPRPKMVANPDGLSLADRVAKRQAAEKALGDKLAAEENERLLKADRAKLPVHVQVFAFITKTRAQYDALEAKLAGAADKEKVKAEVAKLAGGLRASIVAMGKRMATIDPKGGNSNVTTDYDVMLNALANDYPVALAASLDGDARGLEEQKADFDKRAVKVTSWLAQLKAKPKK
jgi:hypothetical protein